MLAHRINGHTCTCPPSDRQFPPRLEGKVSGCTTRLLAPNGLPTMRNFWLRTGGQLSYSSLCLASAGSTPAALPSTQAPAPAVVGRPVIAKEQEAYRRRRDSGLLVGTLQDLDTVDTWLQVSLNVRGPSHSAFHRSGQTDFNLARAKHRIDEFFSQPNAADISVFLLYYAGHGVQNSGNWVFEESGLYAALPFSFIRERWLAAGRAPNQLLLIVADSCNSGQWLRTIRDAHIVAAESESAMCSVGMIAATEASEAASEGAAGGDFTSRFFSIETRGFAQEAASAGAGVVACAATAGVGIGVGIAMIFHSLGYYGKSK